MSDGERIDYALLAVPKPSRPEREAKRLTAKKGLPRVNRDRAAVAHAEAFGAQAEACREIGVCCCCGVTGVTVPHHEPTRAAGGTDEDCVPLLAASCHLRRHQVGAVTFWASANISPELAKEGIRAWMQSPVARYRNHQSLTNG